MARPALNNKAFSLIELMIAVVIIMVSMLAFATSMMIVQRTNMQNERRNIATRLTNQTAEALLALPFTDTDLTIGLHSRTNGDTTQDRKGFPQAVQNIRGYQLSYAIQWNVSPVTGSASALQGKISVGYQPLASSPTITNTAVIFIRQL